MRTIRVNLSDLFAFEGAVPVQNPDLPPEPEVPMNLNDPFLTALQMHKSE